MHSTGDQLRTGPEPSSSTRHGALALWRAIEEANMEKNSVRHGRLTIAVLAHSRASSIWRRSIGLGISANMFAILDLIRIGPYRMACIQKRRYWVPSSTGVLRTGSKVELNPIPCWVRKKYLTMSKTGNLVNCVRDNVFFQGGLKSFEIECGHVI